MQRPAPPAKPLRLLFALVAIGLLAIGGVVGYLVGSSGLQQAVLRVNVENRLGTDLTAQIGANGKVRETVTIPAGQTVSVDLPVAFAASNGAHFEVSATAQPFTDGDTVFVNSPGIYVVSLALG